ncbi:MAG: CRTAC1 family protein [Myxococcales bacterium]|nr:CRTAC1 family protein [Myxococcales bacterium]
MKRAHKPGRGLSVFGSQQHERGLSVLGALGFAAHALGCGPADDRAACTAPPSASPELFVDATAELGVDARHHFATDFCELTDTIGGPGVCVLDADGDGLMDFFATDRAGHDKSLYLRRGDRFEESAAGSGLALTGLDAMGCVAFDYDGDADVDLLVTANGGDRLMQNDGGVFSDVTEARGFGEDTGFSVSATAGDVDGDGDLDLFVGRVVGLATCPDKCSLFPIACKAERSLLWINHGGHFTEDGLGRGIVHAEPTLATLMLDFDHDRDVDIFVGNDMGIAFPDRLYQNDGTGHFTDVAEARGLAGAGTDTMGVDAADFDRDGLTDLVVSDFSMRPIRLYHCYDASLPCSNDVLPDGLEYVKWGLGFVDFDHDGWVDLMAATGPVGVPDGTPTHLYFQRDGEFLEHHASPDEALGLRGVGRGLAFGDLDHDGDVDALLGNAGGPLRVLRNEAASGHSLVVTLDSLAAGAIVRVTTDTGTQTEHALIGGSYAGSSDPRLHFGLGQTCSADVSVAYLDGTVRDFASVPAGALAVTR